MTRKIINLFTKYKSTLNGYMHWPWIYHVFTDMAKYIKKAA